MVQQRHMIKQQILDLRVEANIPAFELQNRLSALYRKQVIPLIETYCNQLCDPDTVLRLDTLDVDLGEIDLETIETDFVTKVEERLYRQLVEKLSALGGSPASNNPTINKANEVSSSPPAQPFQSDRVNQPTAGSKPHPTPSPVELLSFFLQTGRLPWWCESLTQPALEDCFEQLLRTSPGALKALIKTQLPQESPFQRLIYQFSDRILLEMVTFLAPSGSQWVRFYIEDIQALAPHVDCLRGVTPRQFRLNLWQGMLLPLALSPTPSPKAKSFIRNNLQHLATSFQVTVRSLLPQMLTALEQLRTEGFRFSSELPAVLAAHPQLRTPQTIPFSSELPVAIAQTQTPQKVEVLTANPQVWAEIDNLVRLLSAINNSNPEHSISVSLQTKIDTLSPLLLSLFRDAPSDASESPFTRSATTLLTEIDSLATELAREETPPAYRPVIDQIQAIVQSIKLQTRSPKPPISSAVASALPAASAPPAPFKHPVDPFSQSEEIYIQNAGLILFWPFLNRFFETLNLVQANQFIQPQANQRAVLLLQYLVDASTHIPEHLLPLNKLLCGLDLLAPIEAILEITELEQTECDNMLLAVIRHWSALKSTSPDGFRQAFLQRAGILRRFNDKWLLQVERKTYDVLLDQLPWSVRVVKLPWTPEMLSVEW